MKLSYDPKYNVAYIRFHEKLGQVTTLKISDDMNIDIAPDGTVYGVELLNANEQLTRDHGALIVASEHRPSAVDFICLDDRLAAVAQREGFTVVTPKMGS